MKAGQRFVGHPVNVATGVMYSTHEDISIPGKVDFVWEREYTTALLDKAPSPLGPGWTTRYFATLSQDKTDFRFFTPEGDVEIFADPQGTIDQGGIIRNLGTFQELFKRDNRYFIVRWDVETEEIERYIFIQGKNGEPWPLASIEDETGQGLVMLRDATGRLTGIQQCLEKRTFFINYTSDNQVGSISFQMPDGSRQVLVRYEHDDKGRLCAAYDALGYSDHYEYDNKSRMTREIVKDGGVFFFKYDDKGRCIKTSGLDGYDEKTFKYLEKVGWTWVTNSKGDVTRYQCLPSGQVASVSDPLGGEEKTDYDELGRIIATMAPDGSMVRFEYDAGGNWATVLDQQGQRWNYTFDECHQLTSHTDPMGCMWKYIYSDRGNLTSVETPTGARFEYRWDASSNLVEYRTPRGARMTYQYNDRGAMTRKTHFSGVSTDYTYDAFGKKTSAVTLGRTFKFAHDLRGDLVRIDYPDGSTETFSYDAAANLIFTTDRNARTQRYTFGPCKRPLEKISSAGTKIRYIWGTEPEELEAVENAKGEHLQFSYDSLGRLIKEVSFDNRECNFTYDPASQLVAVENGAKEVVKFVLDPCGRLLERHLPNGDVERLTYDLSGMLLTGETKDSSVRFERNPAGQIQRVLQDNVALEYTFDLDGNRTGLFTSLGHRVEFEFDGGGQLTHLTLPDRGAYRFSFNEFDQEVSRLLPGNLRLAQDYDITSHLTRQLLYRKGNLEAASPPSGIRPLLSRKYQRAPDGTVLGIEDGLRGTFKYVYDLNQQIIESLHGDRLVENFRYDPTGNITAYQSYGIEKELRYSPGNHLEQCGDSRYVHDDQGRLIKRINLKPIGEPDVWEFSWDAIDQLRSVRCPNGDLWTYKYDIFGRRVAKIGPGGETKFVWDADTVVHEVDSASAVVSWVSDPLTLAPIAQVVGEEIFSVIPDHMGSPREIVSRQGQIVWAASYSVWGRDVGGKVPSVSCPVRFPGQWFDEETGLHYNRFRYYDPRTGRFISQDPLGPLVSPNTYQYAPNPINFIDPLGLGGDVCKNKKKGDKFKKEVKKKLEGANLVVHEEVAVTVQTGGSKKKPETTTTNMDLVAVDPRTGKKYFIECKASEKAKYTDNQITAGVDQGTLVGPATITAADRAGQGRGGLTSGSRANQTVTTVRPGDQIPGVNANAPSTYKNRSWK